MGSRDAADPRVVRIADALGVPLDEVVGYPKERS
jgi:hypothetical protein